MWIKRIGTRILTSIEITIKTVFLFFLFLSAQSARSAFLFFYLRISLVILKATSVKIILGLPFISI